MIKIEFLAASLAFMEKKKNSMATLLVPPPMPRKEEITPRTVPITRARGRLSTCIDFNRSFLQMYRRTAAVMTVRQAA